MESGKKVRRKIFRVVQLKQPRCKRDYINVFDLSNERLFRFMPGSL